MFSEKYAVGSVDLTMRFCNILLPAVGSAVSFGLYLRYQRNYPAEQEREHRK